MFVLNGAFVYPCNKRPHPYFGSVAAKFNYKVTGEPWYIVKQNAFRMLPSHPAFNDTVFDPEHGFNRHELMGIIPIMFETKTRGDLYAGFIYKPQSQKVLFALKSDYVSICPIYKRGQLGMFVPLSEAGVLEYFAKRLIKDIRNGPVVIGHDPVMTVKTPHTEGFTMN
jgi:hypothetical protein